MREHRSNRYRAGRAFTLIELIVVIVILAVLVGIALPRFFDYSDDARTSADEGAIAGISTAMLTAYMEHRLSEAPSADWVDDVNDIAGVLDTGQLPAGITIAGAKLQDQRGNTYTLTAETADDPARLTQD